ncbi:MAG: hypothetical protein ACO3A2_05940 [Bdellovibrionia bacterium]
MILMMIYAAGVIGAGILFAHQPYAPDATPIFENNNSELADEGEDLKTDKALAEKQKKEAELFAPYRSGLHLNAQGGIALMNYSQTGIPDFSQRSGYFHGSIRLLVPHWRMEARSRFNLTHSTMSTNRRGVEAFYFDATAELGYSLIQNRFLNLNVFGGVAYSELTGTNQILGYPGLVITPTIYPEISFHLWDRVSLDASYRFLYLGRLLDSSQLQTVASVGLHVILGKTHSLSTRLERNTFYYLLNPTTLIQYDAVALTAGFTF